MLRYSPHHRIVLLFDLDCFYAQCERVRLGLPQDVSLALLQWNSVLAVTYPARNFGIKRGDSWEDVAEKSSNACWAIHLHVLERTQEPSKRVPIVNNPYKKAAPNISMIAKEETAAGNNRDEDHEPIIANLEEAYNQIYKLTETQQLECQQRERGVRRFHNEGKACLERYRLASMRIFSVVLESLTKHLGGKDKFVLERASIDEFYLDVTDYCYNQCTSSMEEINHETVVVGAKARDLVDLSSDLRFLALQRACEISHLIRHDVLEILGFTMSAGICTNKMMAKLAATYGKPNGQAVLNPENFSNVLQITKIRKVRHFGGKLGKQVLKLLQETTSNTAVLDGDAATMMDLQQVPLPVLQKHFSEDTANFVFEACRGIDHESVKETTGALVKSITAFKSFPPTSNINEIQNWLSLMATEVVDRVATDSLRNHRYPKTCTLSYTYYTTDSGSRPKGVTSTRSFRNSKSIRLNFPHEKIAQRGHDLVRESLQKLQPILRQHALRGVGLSVSNFEPRGCPPEGMKGIATFFTKEETTKQIHLLLDPRQGKNKDVDLKRKRSSDEELIVEEVSRCDSHNDSSRPDLGDNTLTPDTNIFTCCEMAINSEPCDMEPQLACSDTLPQNQVYEDQEIAKKLQATYDRENFVFSSIQLYGSKKNDAKRTKDSIEKKTRRIDSFFAKK